MKTKEAETEFATKALIGQYWLEKDGATITIGDPRDIPELRELNEAM